jgi:hypothetical protein
MLKLNDPFYAGIGSRDTPQAVLETMTQIAAVLSNNQYVLRSGHADGADLAFEHGSDGYNQIFLPWKDFNYDSPLSKGLSRNGHFFYTFNNEAERIAEAFHPNWAACSQGARKMHTRNVYQVLGPGLGQINTETVSKFVICWTKDGKASGGTGQAIRIAEGCQIPVFNLFHQDALSKLEDFIQETAECT